MTDYNNDPIQVVPLPAYEAEQERNVRTIKYMSIGWAISVVALCMMMIVSLSYSEDVVSETTETTAEVIQDADDNGSNYYAGGNLSGYADGKANSQENNNNQDGQ